MSLRDFGPNELIFLLLAARWTILLALIAFAGGGALGMVRRRAPGGAGARRCAGWRPAYIQFFMGTPLLIQLFMAYYGSSFLGFRPDPWTAAALTFCLNGARLLRRDLPRLHRGRPQGPVGGLARARLRASSARCAWSILPQAMRLMLPPTVGFMVQIVKSTSVASLIGLTELARAAMQVNTVTFEPVTVFGIVALIYFALCWPLSPDRRPSSSAASPAAAAPAPRSPCPAPERTRVRHPSHPHRIPSGRQRGCEHPPYTCSRDTCSRRARFTAGRARGSTLGTNAASPTPVPGAPGPLGESKCRVGARTHAGGRSDRSPAN